MDYRRLVADAWRIMRRYRALWIFGLIAGEGGALEPMSLVSSNVPSHWQEIRDAWFNPPTDATWFQASPLISALWAYLQERPTLVLVVLICLGLVTVATMPLVYIGEGALIISVSRLAENRPISLGESWAIGRRFAWTYF